MACTADWSFRQVFVMSFPQMSKGPQVPVKSLSTIWVMFTLLAFSQTEPANVHSVPGSTPGSGHACVPQNPGVRQISLVTHALFGVNTHPIAGSQVSAVQALLSLHGGFGVKTHPIAGSHVSVVHALLSLHGGLGVKTHPIYGLHASVVHALLSLHVSGVPGLQPDCVVVDAVNWTRLGVVLQPLGEALQVSVTLIPAWSFSVVGSVGTIV